MSLKEAKIRQNRVYAKFYAKYIQSFLCQILCQILKILLKSNSQSSQPHKKGLTQVSSYFQIKTHLYHLFFFVRSLVTVLSSAFTHYLGANMVGSIRFSEFLSCFLALYIPDYDFYLSLIHISEPTRPY